MAPDPNLKDVMTFSDLIWHMLLGAVGLLGAIGVFIMKRLFNRLDDLEKNKADVTLVEMEFSHLKEGIERVEKGQSGIHDRLDEVIPRRKIKREG